MIERPDAGPLGGIRVVVTRPRAQAASLVDALERQGAVAVEVPVIAIVDTPDGPARLDDAIAALRTGDWVVVTSPNGATRVGDARRRLIDAGRDWPAVSVAAIGPGTGARAEAVGVTVDLVPDRSVAEGLAEVFPAPGSDGGTVVLARAEQGRDVVPDSLRTQGWTVHDVAVYRTIAEPVDADTAAACAAADAVAFTSSSTVTHLLDAVGAHGLPPITAAIGPATATTLRERGLEPTVEASVHTIDGLVDALAGHLADEVVIHLEDAGAAAAQWCLRRYLAELDERFPTGVDLEGIQRVDPDDVRPPDGRFLVARLGGRPVGCGGLKRTAADAIDIKRMWVDPEVRGRGLGRALLQRLIDEAATTDAEVVRLDTNASLVEAIALYRAMGFDEVPAFNDEPNAQLWFSRRLG